MIGTYTNEIPNGVRGIAETGLDRSRGAVGTLFATARRNAELMQNAAEFTRNAMLETTARGFDLMEQTVHASLDHAQKLARSRDVQEAMQLQATFLRERFGALQGQAGAIGGLAQSTIARGAEQAASVAQANQGLVAKIAEQNQAAVEKIASTSVETVSEVTDAATH